MPSLEHSGGPSLSSVPSSSGNLRAGAPVSAAPTTDKTSTPSVDQSDQPSGSPSDVHSNEPSSSSSPSVASSTTPSDSPSTSSPTWSPNSHGAEYVPGELTVPCDNERLLLSKGLSCKLLATANNAIELEDGSFSSAEMHEDADGAGVIPHPTDGGWYYTSNSEVKRGKGGVGTIRFNADGGVVGYEMTLEGTTNNCGGGLTPHRTWVSCEENKESGWCWEVDPHTGFTQRILNVPEPGNYESFAYDDQDQQSIRFFTTNDANRGALTRYTPPAAAHTSNPYDLLSTPGGIYDYLILDDKNMTFHWSTNLTEGKLSANDLFPMSEGIDVHNGVLNFVAKKREELFTLDLEAQTWTGPHSTRSGHLFDGQPDQLARIMGQSELLYFCEDGPSSDIHARDAEGKFFTIVKGIGYTDGADTTGLAFSTNLKYMYASCKSSRYSPCLSFFLNSTKKNLHTLQGKKGQTSMPSGGTTG